MMAFSLTQAAKAAKISKSTLSVAIQKGRISATHLPDGSYQIEPAELFRVFSPKVSRTPSDEGVRSTAEPLLDLTEPTVPNPGSAHVLPVTIVELDVLRAQVAAFALERELRDRERESLVGQVEDLRRRLDEEREERHVLQRLLTAPERVQEQPPVLPEGAAVQKPSRGFLGRLLGF
jgi:hypothetical protein